MIGQIISHYKILEKLRQEDGGQVGEVRLVSHSGTDQPSSWSIPIETSLVRMKSLAEIKPHDR